MIGAGIGQVPLSHIIKERNYYLIVVTIPGNYPCIELADKVYYIDIFNKEEVLKIAKNENIDAVISDQNDLMMPTVAFIAEQMQLPGNSFSQVEAYCNKNLFRTNCDKLGIPVPKHSCVSEIKVPDEFKNIPFPWIVKPEDSQSSIGVTKVNSLDEYQIAIKKALECSRNKRGIVEEFFVGDEIVVEGFIYRGKYYNLGFADRKYFDLPNLFIPSQTIFPSIISQDIKNKCIECEMLMCEYINPNFAIVHSEYLVDKQTNEIRIVESALRGGGVYISSHLVPLYCNININEYLLDCALGIESDFSILYNIKRENAAAYICFYLDEGTIESIKGVEKIKADRFVAMQSIDKLTVGQTVNKMTYKGMRQGPIIVHGLDRKSVEDTIERIQSYLKIEISTSGKTIQDIHWN